MKFWGRLSAIFAFCLFFCATVQAAPYINLKLKYDSKTVNYNAERVYLEINGEKMDNAKLPMEPVILDGNTLVPAREVFEKLGASVAWKGDKNEVDILYKNIFVVMFIDNNVAKVSGRELKMNVPPKIINGKTMIPLRFCAESVGLDVYWDNPTRTVQINSEKKIAQNSAAPTVDDQPIIGDSTPVQETHTQKAPTVQTTTAETTTEATTEAIKSITDITLASAAEAEVINFMGSSLKPDITFTGTNIMVINFPKTNLATAAELSSGKYFKNFSRQFLSDNSVQVNLELADNDVRYSLSSSSDKAGIYLYKGDLSMVTYDAAAHKIAIPKNGFNISASSAVHKDDYENLNYYVTFDADLSAMLTSNEINANDDLINKITFSSEGGRTTIAVDEKKILGCKVEDEGGFVTVRFAMPKEIYKNVIALDPGHGADMPGAIGNGLVEKDLTLSICQKILANFENNPDIKVYATRTTDTNPSFPGRVALANDYADIFISVHINSSTGSSAAGTEVHYYDLHTNSAGLTSAIVAETLQRKLIEKLGSIDRNVKQGQNIYVTRNTTVPSVLCEIGFISNPMEAMKMASDSYQQSAADAIYEGCVEFFGKYPSVR